MSKAVQIFSRDGMVETMFLRYHEEIVDCANRYVVDHVDYLISYAWHPASNARELVEYAKRREKKGSLFITLIMSAD